MTLEAIQDYIFSVSKNKDMYMSHKAHILYIEGVSYHLLALAKWEKVKSNKLINRNTTNIAHKCGFCYKYQPCFICPLRVGVACCGGIIKQTSSDMQLKDIKKVLKRIKEYKPNKTLFTLEVAESSMKRRIENTF
jgi:hypothetical protein